MPDRKYLSPRDLKDLGFLLEANRQFFHPHGLALEITRVAEGEGAPVRVLALNATLWAELYSLIGTAEQEGDYPSDELVHALQGAAVYEEGDAWISGVWDVRDDPEGVIFAGLSDEEHAKVKAVAAERERHRRAREALFGSPTDIQPVDWLDV